MAPGNYKLLTYIRAIMLAHNIISYSPEIVCSRRLLMESLWNSLWTAHVIVASNVLFIYLKLHSALTCNYIIHTKPVQ